MKKLFITGATGFVGTHALEYFSNKEEYEIYGTNFGSSIDVSKWIDSNHLITMNLLDKNVVQETISKVMPNYVIHLAALSSPKASFDKPVETITNNVTAQVNLLDALRRVEGKLEKILIIGSAEEYGSVEESDCPIDEMTQLKPTSPYAVSKIAQDFLGLQYYLSYQMPIVRLRPFNHTGERRPNTFVLPAFAQQIAEIEAGKSKSILKVGNLTPVRDFTDVKDMIVAYEQALLKAKPGEVYNIGSGVGISIQEIVDMLLKETDAEIKIEVDSERIKPVDVPVLVADISKFSKETGWRPGIPIQQTIKRVLDYWRDQLSGK